jgi:hypothetical protein
VYSGLALIIISGLAITFLHVAQGQFSIISEPAFLFKWILIGAAAVLSVGGTKASPHILRTGVMGGTWLALFMLHVLAPVATWLSLVVLFVAWMVLYLLTWSLLAYVVSHAKRIVATAPASASTQTPTRAPEPVQTPPPSPPVPPARAFEPRRPYVPSQAIQMPPEPQAPPVPKVPIRPMPVFTGADDVFAYDRASTDDSPMLHPHLTEETLPTQQRGRNSFSGLQFNNGSTNVPALRVMPRTPEELERENPSQTNS